MTSTRTLVLSSNLDENKDKVSEKSHKIISLVSCLLAAPFLPATDANARSIRVMLRGSDNFNDAEEVRSNFACDGVKVIKL